ncbi:MAG: 50S ribosomal protein L1 [Candidatus Acetothermia bacterium]|jgi:large subunit ribosomal protein L1|nr:50S ribosomal protein L1 [Candidatus Acetothermia bacterium]MDH7504886.1 50S ribosomal protein L1 [Candidatus Acetothermia bacterium]
MSQARSRRYVTVKERVDRSRVYPLDEALAMMKELATASFNESADAAFRLAVNPKKNEHRIRGTVILPHGVGKAIRVVAFAKGEKLKEAEEAGADLVGGEDLAKRIEEGWLEFDAAVATPDMMGVVGRLGKILGPRGLMPSPKSGTVTAEIGQAVRELKQGKVEFRLDEYGNIHSPFGRCSFSTDQLRENLLALAQAIFEEKPADVKGKFLRAATVSSTMGPGIKLDPDELSRLVAARML